MKFERINIRTGKVLETLESRNQESLPMATPESAWIEVQDSSAPREFPTGITAPRIETTESAAGVVLVDDLGSKYTLTPVGGLPTLQQISASPERDKEEIKRKVKETEDRLKAARIWAVSGRAWKEGREEDERAGRKPKVADVLTEILERLVALEEQFAALRGAPLESVPDVANNGTKDPLPKAKERGREDK